MSSNTDIRIPKRLSDHLKKEDKWQICVTKLKGEVEQFLSRNPEFFPDYTNHGVDHINEVLAFADKLIVDDAFREGDKDEDSGILDAMDVAYLVCAILIHDLGMFLHQDGVKKLTCGEWKNKRIRGIGDDPWHAVWQAYADRTKRSSAEHMYYHFGKLITVSETCVSKAAMDDDDKRIIGEFLRQNHGRLAHEIAVYGLPGSEDIDLFRHTGLDEEERNLIGLLARSHSMNIRDTEEYLEAELEKGPMPGNTPIFYLMSVLRIADYLDAGVHRAPSVLEANQHIHVPVSVEEWAWNQRIERSKCKWMLKNKNRHIHADPKSSIEYVQLDKWLRRVQAELDLCWSILAEQYPNGYRLSIHRVTSRIHQSKYQKKMNESFLTKEVKVTANPEVTRLLIAPLYGSDPSYGVRELLQNAVDACVERKHREGADYKGLVTIRIDRWADPKTGENLGKLTIEDNGIGMNEHVLLNYYLSAGASYRSSDEWKRDYAAADGKPQIARTGKFGVGFLAAFLLGDRIKVTTRHIRDDVGYAFTYTNEPKPLDIRRLDREPGTTIEIRLKEGVWEKLERGGDYRWFSWYAFDDPKVWYFFDGEPREHRGISLCREPERNTDWFKLKSKDFDTYLWNPNQRGSRGAEFYCNGIRVYGTKERDSLEMEGLNAAFPDVSLLDPRARLDIDLARAKLETFPEREALLRQVFRYYIARLLLTPWRDEGDYRENLTLGFSLDPAISDGRRSFLLTSRGFTLHYASVLAAMAIKQCVILYADAENLRDSIDELDHFLPNGMPVVVFAASDGVDDERLSWYERTILVGLGSPETFARAVMDDRFRQLAPESVWYSVASNLANLWLQKNMFPALGSFGNRRLRAAEQQHEDISCYEAVPEESWYRDWYIVPKMPIRAECFDPEKFPVAMHLVIKNINTYSRDYGNPDLLFPRILRELLGPNEAHPDRDMWIPFDMEERKKKFPEAFAELEPYFDYIRRNE